MRSSLKSGARPKHAVAFVRYNSIKRVCSGVEKGSVAIAFRASISCANCSKRSLVAWPQLRFHSRSPERSKSFEALSTAQHQPRLHECGSAVPHRVRFPLLALPF